MRKSRADFRRAEVFPVPRDWTGWPAVLIASGPSLDEAQIASIRAAHVVGRIKVVAVNNSWERAPWADALYACDGAWWHKYRPDFAGERWTQDRNAAAAFGARFIPTVDREGLSTDPRYLHCGRNSGHQALNLAFLRGADPIILVGFDMQLTGGAVHWHGHHDGLNNPRVDLCAEWCRRFASSAAQAAAAGVRIINASVETALTCFERMPIDEALGTAWARDTAPR